MEDIDNHGCGRVLCVRSAGRCGGCGVCVSTSTDNGARPRPPLHTCSRDGLAPPRGRGGASRLDPKVRLQFLLAPARPEVLIARSRVHDLDRGGRALARGLVLERRLGHLRLETRADFIRSDQKQSRLHQERPKAISSSSSAISSSSSVRLGQRLEKASEVIRSNLEHLKQSEANLPPEVVPAIESAHQNAIESRATA